jgi:hypothetical protein
MLLDLFRHAILLTILHRYQPAFLAQRSKRTFPSHQSLVVRENAHPLAWLFVCRLVAASTTTRSSQTAVRHLRRRRSQELHPRPHASNSGRTVERLDLKGSLWTLLDSVPSFSLDWGAPDSLLYLSSLVFLQRKRSPTPFHRRLSLIRLFLLRHNVDRHQSPT